jgi:hypothetical protein
LSVQEARKRADFGYCTDCGVPLHFDETIQCDRCGRADGREPLLGLCQCCRSRHALRHKGTCRDCAEHDQPCVIDWTEPEPEPEPPAYVPKPSLMAVGDDYPDLKWLAWLPVEQRRDWYRLSLNGRFLYERFPSVGDEAWNRLFPWRND